jgi:Tfp pilus assembly protein PilO
VWGYQPLKADRDRTERLLEATREFVESGDSIESEARLVAQRLEETRVEYQHALRSVPDATYESEFLSELSTLAADSNLAIREFRPGGVTHRDRYDELEIRLSAEGTYPNLCRFLAGLEALPRLCNVRSLSVTGTGSSSGNRYPIDMTVVVFFAPLEFDVPLAEEPDDGTA